MQLQDLVDSLYDCFQGCVQQLWYMGSEGVEVGLALYSIVTCEGLEECVLPIPVAPAPVNLEVLLLRERLLLSEDT